MKKITGLILTVVLMLSVISVNANAKELPDALNTNSKEEVLS